MQRPLLQLSLVTNDNALQRHSRATTPFRNVSDFHRRTTETIVHLAIRSVLIALSVKLRTYMLAVVLILGTLVAVIGLITLLLNLD